MTPSAAGFPSPCKQWCLLSHYLYCIKCFVISNNKMEKTSSIEFIVLLQFPTVTSSRISSKYIGIFQCFQFLFPSKQILLLLSKQRKTLDVITRSFKRWLSSKPIRWSSGSFLWEHSFQIDVKPRTSNILLGQLILLVVCNWRWWAVSYLK